jgi:hypothetical protein
MHTSFLNSLNWTMLELVAYEQEIQDVWNNCQGDLQAIREQLLEE